MLARLYPLVAISKIDDITTTSKLEMSLRETAQCLSAKKRQQRKENDRCAKPRICKSMHLVVVLVMPSFNEVYLREHSYRHGGSRLRDVRPSLKCEGWHACKTSKIKQTLCKYTGKQGLGWQRGNKNPQNTC